MELKEVKFRVENVYQWVFLASLASSLMTTEFPCTIFIGRAILMPYKIANRLVFLLEGDYIVIAR